MGSSTEHSAYGPDPQPVGPRPDPRRFRRRLRRGRGRLRGTAGDRHRHRRLDPPAGRGHRHRRGEADLRRGVPLRPRRPGQLARPGRSGDPHRARLGPAARGDRRPRPPRLHLDRRAAARPRRRRPPGRDRRHVGRADRRGQGADRRGLPGRCAGPVRRGRRAARRRGRRGRRGLLPLVRARAGRLLPDPAGGGVVQPREVRRDALRPAGLPRRRRGAQRRGGHAGHPARRLRRRGEAAHHARHLRAVQRLLRRLLRPGPEGAHADQPRLRRGVRAGRRAGLADRADHGVQARREARRPGRDVPQRPGHDPGQPRRRAGHLGAQRARRRGRPADRLPGAGPRARRRPGLPRRRRARGAAHRPVGRPAARPGPAAGAAETQEVGDDAPSPR